MAGFSGCLLQHTTSRFSRASQDFRNLETAYLPVFVTMLLVNSYNKIIDVIFTDRLYGGRPESAGPERLTVMC